MQLIPQHIDELIVRCLAQTASAEEKRAVDEWVNTSESNAAYYRQLKFIYETSGNIKKNVTVDTKAAWAKVMPQLETGEAKIISFEKEKPKSAFILKVAASVAILFVITLTVYYLLPSTEKPNELLSLETGDKSIEQKLPDGSVVTLNPNSTLTALHRTKREYRLAGDAFFDVKHNDKNPFIIHVNNLNIKDIGTSFKVEADPKNDAIRVTVTEGVVQLYTVQQAGITLRKGDVGTYYKSMDVFEKIESDPDSNTQMLNLNFEHTELEEVAMVLSAKFNVPIVFANEDIKKCLITVKFDSSDLNEILDIITHTFDIWVKEENGKITIGGNGCGSGK